jgi:hypothetical protein
LIFQELRHLPEESTMPAKSLILLGAATALLVGVSTSAGAAEKVGKPLDIKPAISKPAISDNWRARALKSRAEAPAIAPPQGGNTRAINERGDRMDDEEAGSGGLHKDQGNGSKLD